MPILSYIAIPASGAKNKLLRSLNAIPYCEAFPADNQDVLILVTDTPNNKTEKELQKQLKDHENLQSLSMTFGYNDEKPMGKGDGYEGQ